ncbi:hypothetical protein SAMN04515668_4816 [Hymenobacter arizonensis]|uniref:Uncharacterized protein n=1 Tax=Hymenobacter arizonensis TaxID=1227077 RepID=A0A1I6BNF3_HYMAR|nr:hypothetical protein SAMN04515668_4816 [Hymenobacter arizonensis]
MGPEQPRPFPGAGAVLLHTREAPAAALARLAAVARKQGYAVDTLSDVRFATAPRTYEFPKGGAVTRAVYRFAADAAPEGPGAVLTLAGTYRVLRETPSGEEPMAYGGARTSQGAACFGQAQRLVFGYRWGKVGYQAQP